ncbi:sulfite oxidase-like oxidoreductase [Nitrospirillum viridazoti]|uniref:Sulfite oxidase-like oxidoreductase n=1 Tax=Nitrospirillum viridazoti CBAmc TaxID=1441467 RepID=A0A248JL58_9PROT|nr:sulfite oxidase-like oxidoreductase [Nitrospirillum amazonense]ASG19477.1 sulfite oxidase-like oxidoreductase [Nitrospirillum amazonense CBAmc]TWB42009.1 DMSO/TMAO reductase YedYZ molybdopterin-dependent catalytic subunit [Nitrospirillum amazonense]
MATDSPDDTIPDAALGTDDQKAPESKLVATKRAWAREGRLLTGAQADSTPAARPRLPPGQRLVTNWPVLDLGILPDVGADDWTLTVDGLVDHPFTWRWADFQDQPAFSDTSDIHCVTSWSRYDNHWRGVSAGHIVALARPQADAAHVLLHSYDGYTTNLSLAAFSAADVLLAATWQGEPLTREHGGPVRLVVPQAYFWKSAKWIRRIQFVNDDTPGFWEVRGYHNEGDPWTEQRYG